MYTRARMGRSARHALFQDLWHYYYRRLYMFVRRLSVDPEELDDAVQEVMLKVSRRLNSYRPEYAISTWIYSIARNHCIDMARSRALREVGKVRDDPDSSPGLYPSPEEQLERADVLSYAERLVNSLAPEDQQIALLRFYEEMPSRQISSVLEIPAGTLKYRVHRIRHLLRQRHEEECVEKEKINAAY